MRAAFFTLGCKVNQYETAVLEQYFAAAGFDIVQPDNDADVYVINSCTVTAEGDRKSRQMLRRFRRQNPAAVTCLTGCFPQAFPDAASAIPEADIIMGSKNRKGLLEAVWLRMAGGERIIDIRPHQKGDAFEEMRADKSSRTRAFVKIQDGCDRYCAYCIIPTARGHLRSKPLNELGEELRALAGSGYREVVLVGINLSCYGKDVSLRLMDAVKLACAIPGIERVRLGSLEPELLSPEDIGAMRALPKLCPQFHLSLQSGCDETLARMRRRYTAAEYRAIVRNLRAAFPDCAITTDIMVGFPGETPEEFERSCEFVQEIGFAKAHVFAYSQRPGTAAATMPDQVTKQEKTARAAKVAAITDEGRAAFLEAQMGKAAQVLVEQRLEQNRWEGYTKNYTPVIIRSDENIAGRILQVRLVSVEGDSCIGEIAEE